MSSPERRPAGRSSLRGAFDRDALLYDEARPGYPEQLFDDLIELSRAPPGGRILEIGCGTGQATLPLARRQPLINPIWIDPSFK